MLQLAYWASKLISQKSSVKYIRFFFLLDTCLDVPPPKKKKHTSLIEYTFAILNLFTYNHFLNLTLINTYTKKKLFFDLYIVIRRVYQG